MEERIPSCTLVVSNQSLVSPLPEVAQERDRCFDAITREFCPSGFVETLLARQTARDAARILRDERLLDALEARSITALAPVVGADSGSAEAFLENFPEVYVSKPLELLARRAQRNSQSFYANVRRLRETQAERILSSVSISNGIHDLSTNPAATSTFCVASSSVTSAVATAVAWQMETASRRARSGSAIPVTPKPDCGSAH